MLCRPAVVSARFTLTIIEKVLWETGNPFRAVWAKVQITSTIVTSGLSRSSSTGLPLEAAAECVPDVDPAVGRPDTLRRASHNVCPHPAYHSGALPHVLLAHRFSVSVIMSVTYGYNMDEGETFVTSMQRAGDIFLRFATPERSASCNTFPFSGCRTFYSASLDLLPGFVSHSYEFAGMASKGGAQV